MFTPSRDRGAAAVEFALVLPVLLLVVIGIIEFGRAYNIQTTLSNAARDGVRVMALKDSPSEAKATVMTSADGLSLTESMIDVSPESSCVTTGATDPGLATVTIEYPFALVSGFLPIDDFTLTGTGSMRCFG